VTESTPPITWTFTGETQESFEVIVTPVGGAGNGGARASSSGRITSTATTYSLPEGLLTSPDITYTVTLRVWDTDDRESIAGDPAYTEATQNFTFTPSATVATVTGLTSTWVSPYPKISLGFSRSTAPDGFTILRNRKVIATEVPPGDLFVSGTAYAYVDPSPSPATANVYEVMAVVNGVASASNPTTTLTIATQGIWLADLTRTTEVMITGKADRNFSYGENSEVLEVIGSTEVVLVTQALRGLEGTVSGGLYSGLIGLSTTAQQWRDALLALKARPGQRLWLTVGDLTLQVVIRNVSISPRPVSVVSFDVSFEFYQVGDLQFTPAF
jgi:hypothetical protein